jgi:amidase
VKPDPTSPSAELPSRRAFLAAAGAATLGVRVVAHAEPRPLVPLLDPTAESAARIAAAIRRREISSVEVLDAVLARIDRVNPSLNAVVKLDRDRARESAKAADRERPGTDRPLHGVPITIKDSFDTAGIITTGGTWGRREHVPTEDATVVARLRKAGAIVIGKTNTPELTAGAETNNAVYGRSSNPYDVTRTPGGSSGGGGAIIAAGGSPFDVGTDTSGSIRLPAHFCGIAGLKPTNGRLSRAGHILGPEGTIQGITQPGPMARRVEDLTLGMQVLTGPDPRDPFIIPMPLRDPALVKLRGLRVAVFTDNGVVTPVAPIIATVNEAAAALRSAGAQVTEARPEGLALAYESAFALMSGDGGATLLRVLDQWGTDAAHSEVRTSLEQAKPMPVGEFTALLERVDRARAAMLPFLDRFDLIVSPPNVELAVPHGTNRDRLYAGLSYTVVYNVAGWPAGVVRGGTSPEGLPVGVQVIAPPWREDLVLAALSHLESTLGGWKAPRIG